jgi:hypothetical protein
MKYKENLRLVQESVWTETPRKYAQIAFRCLVTKAQNTATLKYLCISKRLAQM